MPRKYLMTWEGSPNYRWSKMYKGTRYRVSCDDLRAPRTKEGSYLRANDWWLKKLAQLDVQRIDPERQEILDAIQTKLDYAANHAPELVEELQATREAALTEVPGEIVASDADVIRDNMEIARMVGVVIPEDLDPEFAQQWFGDRRLWQERLKNHRTTETNRTVGFQLEKFLEEVKLSQKPKTFLEFSSYLRSTLGTDVWTAETSVDNVDEQTISRHYHWLANRNLVPVSHNKYLGFFRRFVGWLYSSGLIDNEPRNLREKSHRKKKVHKPIKKFENIREEVDSLDAPFRLWVLLGLNCGMTPADLGEITWDTDVDGYPQIDTQKWILTRRRVKTGDQPQVPTVRYKLWPETIKELKKLPTRKGLLFLTSNKTPMYETKYQANGKPTKKDLFSDYWQDIKDKPSFTLGKVRSISSTQLKKRPSYRGYVDYFLAHAPGKLSDQDYSAEDDDAFFEALEFIRKALGFGKQPSPQTTTHTRKRVP